MTAIAAALAGAPLFYFSAGINTDWLPAWFASLPLLWLAFGKAPAWQVFAAAFAAFFVGQASALQAYPVMAFMLAAMAALTAACYGGAILFARLAYRTLPARAAVFAFPLLWTGLEYLQASVSPNGSYGALAYSQVGAPALIQSASLLGLWSVSFLLCAVASGIALMLRGGRRAFGAGLSVVALFAINLAYGLVRLAAPVAGPALPVAALGNGDAELSTTAQAISRKYTEAAAGLAAQGAHVIVLPEEIAILAPSSRDAIDGFAALARRTGSHIVAGYREFTDAPRNVAFTFSPDGRSRYVKRHLIPGLEPVSPGNAPGILGGGQAVAICKDMDFGTTIRGDARQGITMMFVPAWDFGLGAEAHADMAIMRGVENGFAMVRAARNGLLTITDAQGRVIARAPATSATLAAIQAAVSPGPGATLYTHIGDLFAWACAAASIAMAAAIGLRRLPARA